MELTITDAAKAEMRKSIGPNRYLKIGLEKSGCCGYAFVVKEGTKFPEDKVIQVDEFQVLVVPFAQKAFKKAIIDYKAKGINKGYKFIPN